MEPELIDGLIRATKDGDMQKFQEVLGSDKSDLAEVSEVEEESEDEDQVSIFLIDHLFCV